MKSWQVAQHYSNFEDRTGEQKGDPEHSLYLLFMPVKSIKYPILTKGWSKKKSKFMVLADQNCIRCLVWEGKRDFTLLFWQYSVAGTDWPMKGEHACICRKVHF